MSGFKTREEMVAAYARKRELDGVPADVVAELVDGVAVYVPHLYRGGWVIRGFGYSVERVGVYVAAGECGDPLAV